MIRVVQTFGTSSQRSANPFTDLLYRGLAEKIQVEGFSWRKALIGRYDVLHVHWPEYLFGGSTVLRAAVKMMLTVLLLVRIRISPVAVVRTVHNATPHESLGNVQRRIARYLDACTHAYIVMNPETEVPEGSHVRYIPHGHYRDWFAGISTPEAEVSPGKMLYFGIIRRYKGVEALLTAFAQARSQKGWRLRLVGKLVDAEVGDAVTRSLQEDSRVSATLEFVSDDLLAADILSSTLVVLPYAGLNSGSILLALSLARPVLTMEGSNSRTLQREFGQSWVRTYAGSLSADELSEALAWASSAPRAKEPDMSRREWDLIADQHLELYRWAISNVRRRVGARRSR